MVTVQKHRGPDDTNIVFLDGCVLGHNRLSIIDLESGRQPMRSSQSAKHVVFNGEIYGYTELRKRNSDYVYHTKSDTEVILALHEKYDVAMLDHLPGMFAFAVWDETRKALFAARDRMGEKPFYYAFGRNNEFIFASEIKTILASGLIDPVLNIEALENYLKHFYILPDKTIYSNVFVLPPAHYLTYSANNLKTSRYWNIPATNDRITKEEACEQFKLLFENSVAKQLIADVPVGIFLSGGLDSSTITAIASRYQSGIKTFSYGYLDSWNELPFAKETATLYHTDHTELFDRDVVLSDVLVNVLDAHNEPIGDTAAIPTYLLSKAAARSVKVVLGGDGADELLGGYGYYGIFKYYLENKNNTLITNQLNRVMAKLFALSGSKLGGRFTQKYYGNLLGQKFTDQIDFMANHNNFFSDQDISSFFPVYNPQDTHAFKSSINYNESSPNDGLKFDIENWLPGNVLAKTDRCSMANSLEVRAPFLDVDLVEFTMSLPFSLKLNKEESKHILRESYRHLWAEAVRKRTIKQGFGAPVSIWLNDPKIKEMVDSYLSNSNSKIYTLFNYECTKSYCNENDYRKWILFVLALWMEMNSFSFPNT